jgi:hypothetical protein
MFILKNNKKRTNTLCGQNSELPNIKQAVHKGSHCALKWDLLVALKIKTWIIYLFFLKSPEVNLSYFQLNNKHEVRVKSSSQNTVRDPNTLFMNIRINSFLIFLWRPDCKSWFIQRNLTSWFCILQYYFCLWGCNAQCVPCTSTITDLFCFPISFLIIPDSFTTALWQ